MITIIMSIFTFNLLWAVYTTFSKEKIMIQQGEGTLPTSTYSFLVIRHLVRMGLYLLAFYIVPFGNITTLVGFKLFIGVLVLSLLIELISAVLETIARLIYFRIVFRKEGEK